MTGYGEKSIKVIEFTGKDFKIWSRNFAQEPTGKATLEYLEVMTRYLVSPNMKQTQRILITRANKKQIIQSWRLNELHSI